MSNPEITLMPEGTLHAHPRALSEFVVRVASWGGLGQTNADRLLAFAQPLLDDNTSEVLDQIAGNHPGALPQSFDFIAPALRVASDFEIEDLYAYRLPGSKNGRWEVATVWALTAALEDDDRMLTESRNDSNPEIPEDLRPAIDIASEKRGVVILEKNNRQQIELPASWPNLHALELHTVLQTTPEYIDTVRPQDVIQTGLGYFGLSSYDPLSHNKVFRALTADALINYRLTAADIR